jgi:hypothetical protein
LRGPTSSLRCLLLFLFLFSFFFSLLSFFVRLPPLPFPRGAFASTPLSSADGDSESRESSELLSSSSSPGKPSTAPAFRFCDISSCLMRSKSSSNLMCALASSLACRSERSRSYLSFPDCMCVSIVRTNIPMFQPYQGMLDEPSGGLLI